MRIVSLYSSCPSFKILHFQPGVNIILGGKLQKENNFTYKQHDVGKSLALELIDFCLLGTINVNSSLYKIQDEIQEYYFFLELILNNGEYITLARSIGDSEYIYYKITDQSVLFKSIENFFHLSITELDDYLTSYINANTGKDFNFRKTVKCFYRTTNKYTDPLNKEDTYSHADIQWLPTTLNSWGFGYKDAYEYIQLFDEQKKNDTALRNVKHFLNLQNTTKSVLKKRILILENEIKEVEAEIKKLQQQAERYDFYVNNDISDKKMIKDIDLKISECNNHKYLLLKKIQIFEGTAKLQTDFNFNDKVKKIFEEASISFTNKLVSSYEILLEFNKQITIERNKIISQQLTNYREQLQNLNTQLKELIAKKNTVLPRILSADWKDKFKEFQKNLEEKYSHLGELQAELKRLNSVRNIVQKKEEISQQINLYAERFTQIQQNIIIEKTNEGLRSSSADIINKEILLNLSLHKNKKPNITITDTGEGKDKAGETISTVKSILYDISLLQSYELEKEVDLPHYLLHDSPLANVGQYIVSLVSFIANRFQNSSLQYICTAFSDQLFKNPDVKNKILELLQNQKVHIVENLYASEDDYSHTLFGKKI